MNADQKKWTEISIAYETEPDERTDRQRMLTRRGLCNAATSLRLWKTRTSPYDIAYIKLPIIAKQLEDIAWWDYGREHDLYRATFAAFMAALSAKDIKEMLES